jgi:hypothetical protein
MRRIAARVLAVVVASTLVSAQTGVTIVTGDEAAKSFTFDGKPLHPFCVFFPFDSARKEPLTLAACTNRAVVPKAADGWLGADYSGERAGSASYRVLAKKGDRYLVASNVSGGGSGQFSFLRWLHLGSTQIEIAKEEAGGDRCSGGLESYTVDGREVRFAMNMTPRALALAAAPQLTHEVEDALSERYVDCYAAARYRYDLERERYALTSVDLLSEYLPEPSTDKNAATSPQGCLDALIRQRIRSRRTALSPSALSEFGRTFLACLARSSR